MRTRLSLIPVVLFASAVAAPLRAAPSAGARIIALRIDPPAVHLSGRYSETRLLVEGRQSGGSSRDVSAYSTITCADNGVANVDANGVVRPVKDGRTTLVVHAGGVSSTIPVEVTGVAKSGPPSFINDVIPIMTRAGCSSGACHGAGAGKGGFKLSLLGYDPDSDYAMISRGAGARRVAPSQPDNSLLLRKPTLQVAHKGGLRLKVGSPEYRVLRDWIRLGMPGPNPKDPRLVRLEVVPNERTLAPGNGQRFAVRAHMSDGSIRDATSQTLFTASDESVATVTPDGDAKVVGRGEGAVLIRYQGLVTRASLISPFSAPKPASFESMVLSPSPQRGTSVWGRGGRGVRGPGGLIDRLELSKLASLGLQPSPKCSDSDFMRRAYLDVIGILPTPDEARAFLNDKSADKRATLVDTLLKRPEFVDFWALRWGDILRSSRNLLDDKGVVAFNAWIRRAVADNEPWDKFARELILATGSTYDDGPANFYKTATTPQDLAETTSQAFLGVRIQCAKCHNHPYEKWTQNQYYEMAAFFARVKTKRGERDGESEIYCADKGEVSNPRTQKQMSPCALDATPVSASYNGDRRTALATWLTSPRNPFFSHVIVNRIWRHFMGRGFVEPVDDLRATNPPSNGPLFDALSDDLAYHGFDLKRLMRSILLSETYQRTATPIPANVADSKYYSHYAFKRLSAEQLLDAISAATSVPEKFAGYPAGLRAEQLPDTTVASYFLDLFGRPGRMTTCECERSDDPNLGQVLHLMNSAGVNDRLTSKTGRIYALIAAKTLDKALVEELYLATVSRFPTDRESKAAVAAVSKSKNRDQAAQDLLWALLNSKEFVFNH